MIISPTVVNTKNTTLAADLNIHSCGCCDQQQAMEKAFSGPYVLKQRLGRDLDAHDIAAMDLEALEEVFAKPPALHRFPRAFAKRMHEMCQILVAQGDEGRRQGSWLT